MYAPSRRLVYLSAHQVTAFNWQAGVLTDEGSFEATETGKLQFARYVADHSRSVFSILANLSEEGFHIEMIPFLRGEDRRAIITRKLGQFFFNATLTTSLSLGHEKSRRKDERIMLAALTNNEVFAPWLAAIAKAEVALAGIYSLPLLAPLLISKLPVPDDRCLLLTIQDQSIRQSYLEKGRLHLSRLTFLQDSSIGGVAQTFANEARKLQQYLVSQRLIGRQQPISVYLLTHANARKAVESSCPDGETLSFTILDIEDCTRACGLKTLPADSRCEPLFLHLLATNPPRAQFASDRQRHDYHLWLFRYVLRGVATVTLFACLLWGGKQLYDAHQINQEVAIISTETALARRRYDDIVKAFPQIPTSNESLRRVVSRYVDLEKGSRSPEYLWREISRALQGVAPVEIDAIDWKSGPQSSPASAKADVQRTEGPALDQETAVVSGTLRPGPDSNPRQVLAIFKHFLEALKQNPKLEVDVLQQPFDVEPGKSLSSDAAIEERQPRSFKLQVRRAVGP